MNEKQRWQAAVIGGLLLNLLLIAALLFSFAILPKKEVPPKKMPVLTLVKVPPPNAAPPQKVKVTPVAPPAMHQIAPAKNAPPQKEAKKAPAPPPPPAPAPPLQSAKGNVKNVPPRYHMPSLKGINLASEFDPMHPPETPKPLPGNKYPVVPKSLMPLKREMTVEITFMVEKDGSVKRADVTKTSGNEDLDNAALAAVYTWHFKPMNKAYPIPIPEMFIFPPAK